MKTEAVRLAIAKMWGSEQQRLICELKQSLQSYFCHEI